MGAAGKRGRGVRNNHFIEGSKGNKITLHLENDPSADCWSLPAIMGEKIPPNPLKILITAPVLG